MIYLFVVLGRLNFIPGAIYPRCLELRLQLLVELSQISNEVAEILHQEPEKEIIIGNEQYN